MGFQVTGATFSSVNNYGPDKINAKLKSINEADPFVLTDVTGENKDYATAQFTDSTKVKAAGTAAVAAIKAKIATFTKEMTITQKLAAIDEVVTAENVKIDAAYAAVLKETKEKAVESVTALSDAISSENYSDTDRESILAANVDAINACTSIQAINGIVNNKVIKDKLTVGSANTLYGYKGAALAAIEGALEGVLESEPSLDKEHSDYETLVNNLKTWGVEVTSLPGDVAKEYLTKISSATSFEVYAEDSEAGAEVSHKKGDVVLQVEGVAAVKNCLADLKETLAKNIRDSYLAEIEGSTVLAGLTNLQGTLKSLVEETVSNFTVADPKLNLYVDVTNTNSLVCKLEKVINDQKVTAFNEERLLKASADAKVTLKAAAEAEKSSDADYKKAIDVTKNSADATTHPNKFVVANPKIGIKEGNNDYQILNPFFTATQDATDKKYYATSENNAGAEFSTYSVDLYYASLFDEDGKLIMSGVTSPTAIDVKAKVANLVPNFAKIHEEASEVYMNAQKTAAKITGSDLEEDWEAIYESSDSEYTMTDVSNSRKAFTSFSALLYGTGSARETLDRYIKDIKDVVGTGYTSVKGPKLESEFKALKEKVLKGEAGLTEVETFKASLAEYNAADVKSYKEDTVRYFNRIVGNILEDTVDPISTEQSRIIEDRALRAVATLETGFYYDNTTYTGIDAWFEDAKLWVSKTSTALDQDGNPTTGYIVSKGLLGIEDIKATDTQTKEEVYLSSIRSFVSTNFRLGKDGHNVYDYAEKVASEMSTDVAYDSTTKTFKWVCVGKQINTLKTALNGLKLNAEWKDEEPLESGLKQASLIWDVSSIDKIDTFYKDWKTIYELEANQAVLFSSAEDKALEAIKTNVGKFIGTDEYLLGTEGTVGTDVTVKGIEKELSDELSRYFSVYNENDTATSKVIVSATTTATSTTKAKITAISVSVGSAVVLTGTAGTNAGDPISWTGTGFNYTAENVGLKFINATTIKITEEDVLPAPHKLKNSGAGLIAVADASATEKFAFYNFLTSKGINDLIGDLSGDLTAIDGKASA